MSGIVNQIAPGAMALFSRRAMYPCWVKFGVNKSELSCLSALSGYLSFRGKSVVSWLSFKRAVTGNSKEQSKMEGYLKGLFRLKLIEAFEYKRKPGSFCVGITPLGFTVLAHYERSLYKLQDSFRAACVSPSEVREEYERAA